MQIFTNTILLQTHLFVNEKIIDSAQNKLCPSHYRLTFMYNNCKHLKIYLKYRLISDRIIKIKLNKYRFLRCLLKEVLF